ncbi:hypothetical protein PRIPAC_71064 [Pristionchus pacificus]|uniref:Uncharacterized protein n=1 Tax=Pristionchus pacificus TaxID=54126 RepID=A0A2A6C0H9_PRIPA|nr:hypothetical protein PRIPAC_71064 [Pristionchus pacificus]|eukprot:PDM71597.1 hypothetical protein PRIPAC_38004 [Pristionchus pacificus]
MLSKLNVLLTMMAWIYIFPQVQALQDFLDIFYPICSDIFCLSLPYYTLFLPGPVNTELLRIVRRVKQPSLTTSIVRPTMSNIP